MPEFPTATKRLFPKVTAFKPTTEAVSAVCRIQVTPSIEISMSSDVSTATIVLLPAAMPRTPALDARSVQMIPSVEVTIVPLNPAVI